MWTLVLFMHAGILSGKDSMTSTTIPNFKSEAVCMAAGKQSAILVKGTTKDLTFVCLKQD